MNKFFLVALLILGFGTANAQKFAYVNTQDILEKLPEFQKAQKEIDALSEKWQKEVEAKQNEIEKMYQAYQKEQILLPDEMKRKREDEIIQKEKELKEFQRKIFGTNGELFQKRQELIKPIQEKIYKAIEEVAQQGGFQIIFDKSNNASILFTDPKLDKSKEVLKKLGQ
jgi:outer membrane protein